jgi:Tol biopolymer transport system component
MGDLQTLVRDQMQRGGTPTYSFDDLHRRGERKRRNGRIAEGALGLALFAALAVLLLVGIRLDRSRPGGTTPTPTPSAVTRATLTSRPFSVDLRTGDSTPLSASLVPHTTMVHLAVNYSVSPDGKTLAYDMAFNPGSTPADVMRVATLDGSSVRQLRVPEGLNGYLPRWSPDGSMLVYQLREGGTSDVGNLFLEDVATGRRTQLTDLKLQNSSSWFLAARFTPDGKNVIFQLPRTPLAKWDVWSVPVTGGEPTLVLRDAGLPEYFPDGKTLAFVDNPFGGTGIQIADPDGSRRMLVKSESGHGIAWPEISPDGSRIAYQDGGSIYVVRVSTGESSKVADGDSAVWLDDNTLIVSP